MNDVTFIGRIAKDIELKKTNGDISVVRFTLAVDRSHKVNNEKVTDFFNIVAWRGVADNIGKYCKKGDKICVKGELQNRSYQASDGRTKYVTELNAEKCMFL